MASPERAGGEDRRQERRRSGHGAPRSASPATGSCAHTSRRRRTRAARAAGASISVRITKGRSGGEGGGGAGGGPLGIFVFLRRERPDSRGGAVAHGGFLWLPCPLTRIVFLLLRWPPGRRGVSRRSPARRGCVRCLSGCTLLVWGLGARTRTRTRCWRMPSSGTGRWLAVGIETQVRLGRRRSWR